MRKTFLLLLISASSVLLTAQTDQQALKIMDKFSSTALTAPSLSMKFKLITVNQPENSNDTVAGSIIMAKDQYKLEMPDNITWFNGSTSWNYLKAEKEVTITKPGKKDDSFMSKPSAIFTLYKKGYKVRYVEENAASYIVDLYPEDIKSDLIRIRLAIGKTASDLVGAEYKRKDGITAYLVVSEYNLKVKADAAIFTFNPQNYKGIEVIDMR
jgi:outer membrane lipoprotein carrier protein